MEEQQAMEMENERLVEQLSSLTSQVPFQWIDLKSILIRWIGGAGAEQGGKGG